MRYVLRCLMLCIGILAAPGLPVADETHDYLYYRDVLVPPYQSLREFFDMPERPGVYEVHFISESFGPLTFRVESVHEDVETVIKQTRSYHVDNHRFQTNFYNPDGQLDLRVEVSNSNPVAAAKVSVIIIEVPIQR